MKKLSCPNLKFFLPVLLVFGLISCAPTPAKEKWSEELDRFISLGDTASYNLDSVKVNVLENVCQLQYHLRSFQLAGMDSTLIIPVDSTAISKLDSSAAEEETTVLFPLFMSQEPIDFLSYPVLETEKQPELITIESKNGGFFYLVALTAEEIRLLKKNDSSSPAAISCTIQKPLDRRRLFLPQNFSSAPTAYYITTSWNRTLADRSVTFENDELREELNQYPRSLRSHYRTFVTHSRLGSSHLLGFGTDTTRIITHAQRIWFLVILFFLCLFFTHHYFTGTLWKRRVKLLRSQISDESKQVTLIDEMVKDLDIALRDKFYYNPSYFQELRDRLLLNLSSLSSEWELWDVGKIESAPKFFSNFRMSKESYTEPQRHTEAISRIYRKLMREQTPKEGELQLMLMSIRADVFLLRQAVITRSFLEEKQHFFNSYGKVLLLTVLLLLAYIIGFSQTNPKKYIVRDLQVELTPDFVKPGKMNMKAHLRMLVSTWDTRQKYAYVGFQFLNYSGEAVPKAVPAPENGVVAEGTSAVDGYRYLVKSKYKSIVSPAFFKILRDTAYVRRASSTNEERLLGRKKSDYSYIDIDIPFVELSDGDSSTNSWGIHTFPWDKRQVKTYINLEQFSEFLPPKMTLNSPFIVNDSRLCVKDGVSSSCFSIETIGGSKMFRNGSTVVISTTLTRNAFARWLLPLLLLVLALVAGWASSKPDNGGWKVFAGAFGFGAVSWIYKFVMDKYYPAVPDFLDGTGHFTYFDCLFAFSFVLFLATAVLLSRSSSNN